MAAIPPGWPPMTDKGVTVTDMIKWTIAIDPHDEFDQSNTLIMFTDDSIMIYTPWLIYVTVTVSKWKES